ncbi:hypothetical protein DFP73DRAFT_559422 [Morchella snyderi]|nr:hypothetical protein DFP73DRAFT_559422 [Morchella snyderi]
MGCLGYSAHSCCCLPTFNFLVVVVYNIKNTPCVEIASKYAAGKTCFARGTVVLFWGLVWLAFHASNRIANPVHNCAKPSEELQCVQHPYRHTI